MVEHIKARTLIEAPLFNKESFDKKRIHIPLLSADKAKKEKAPGRRCLADQTPLSVWSRKAPLKLKWVVFDPRGTSTTLLRFLSLADHFLRCNSSMKNK